MGADLSTVPNEHKVAIRRAVEATFGMGSEVRLLPLVPPESPTLTYQLDIGGDSFVLQLVPHPDAMRDPVRRHTCMRIAAEAGLAPPVLYTSDEDGVSISEYVPTTSPFATSQPNHALLQDLAAVVARLHATPLFPPLVDFLDGVDMFIDLYRADPVFPESVTEPAFKAYRPLQHVYPRHQQDWVSSHNDLHPGNLRFDGQRIWVVDWEAAFRNDRYVDLAILGKTFAPSPADEKVLLASYFGAEASAYQHARYFLMQQVTHMYYAMSLLRMAGPSSPNEADTGLTAEPMSLREFNRRQQGPGATDLATDAGRRLYGRVLLEELRRNLESERAEQALTILAAGQDDL